MALHMLAKITQANGQRTALHVICPSRTHLDQIVANACPDHRGYQTAVKRGRLDLPIQPAAPAPLTPRLETAMPHGTPETQHPHISLLDLHRQVQTMAEQDAARATPTAAPAEPTRTPHQAWQDGYDAGLIDAGGGSIYTAVCAMVLGAVLALVLVGALPEQARLLLPNVATLGR
jgi:hypothetical protein